MTLKVRILQFLTTFTQLTARLENFLRGWLLVLGLKEGLVECATVCIKSEVILAQCLDPYIIVFTSHIHTSTRSELNQICSTYYFAATLKWFITRRIGTRPQAINTLWLFIIIFEPQREILGSLLMFFQNVKSCHWILNPFSVPFAVHFQVTMYAKCYLSLTK